MTGNLKTAVMENMAYLEKAISEKSVQMAQLKEELALYESILAILQQSNRIQNGARRERVGVNTVLRSMPDIFTSKEFVGAAVPCGISALYLRQMLTRWAKQGKLKRLERGKYQKNKRASADGLVA